MYLKKIKKRRHTPLLHDRICLAMHKTYKYGTTNQHISTMKVPLFKKKERKKEKCDSWSIRTFLYIGLLVCFPAQQAIQPAPAPGYAYAGIGAAIKFYKDTKNKIKNIVRKREHNSILERMGAQKWTVQVEFVEDLEVP